MKKTEKKHWYDSVVRPFHGKRDNEKDNDSQKSQALPVIALPMIEEWASPEDFAA